MVVHPSANHLNNTLANGVKYYLKNKKKIRPINRLDRDTSGIVLFAKNEYIQELLKSESSMKKEYLAVVSGILDEKSGTINKPIARKEGSIMEREINENGQEAITHYDVVKENNEEGYSLVHVILETGRTHQIRVHFASIGHSILGDTLYGMPSEKISHQALHAWKLTFVHPITKEQIKLKVSAPWERNINKIRE